VDHLTASRVQALLNDSQRVVDSLPKPIPKSRVRRLQAHKLTFQQMQGVLAADCLGLINEMTKLAQIYNEESDLTRFEQQAHHVSKIVKQIESEVK